MQPSLANPDLSDNGQSPESPAPSPESQRIRANRANAQHSTGPRTEAGKRRSAMNALTHGLTASSPVIHSEDPAAFETLRRQLTEEFQPKTASESQLVRQIADTTWRLNRIPLLEAGLLDRAANPPDDQSAIEFDIVDAHNIIVKLGMHTQRLNNVLHKTMDKLRAIQAERRERERFQLKEAAALLALHQHKGIEWDPSQDGFVFSKEEVERFAQHLMRLNESRHIEHVRYYASQVHMRAPGF